MFKVDHKFETMKLEQLDRYICMGKFVEECKAEWQRRYGNEYPFVSVVNAE